MSSFLCFLCHSTVNADTNEDIREKYKEVVGMHLCMDSHLCYICCHVLNKLWLFRAVCLKRSLEYPVLFSEKGTLNLQRNDLEINTICTEDICGLYHNRNINSKLYQINYEDSTTMNSQEFVENVDNRYVELEDERIDFEEYFRQEDTANAKQETVLEDRNPYINESNTENTIQDDYNNFNENIEKINDVGHNDSEKDIINENDNFETEHPENFENNDQIETITEYNDNNGIETKESLETETKEKDVLKTKKSKKSKKKSFEKITLSLEEQKAELDKRRKEKKYLEAEFKCHNCAIGFFFKDTYQTHMMRHEESNGEYRCQTCTLRFATPDVLRAHYKNHSTQYVCARCGARLGARARCTHARRCGRGRGRGRADRRACHLCAGMFPDGHGLHQHLKRFHQTKTSNRTYPCSVCGKTYSNQAAVRTHMIKHINRKFDCSDCQSTFSSPYTLAQHKKKKHSGVKTEEFYCEICNTSYSSRKSLLAHKRKALNHLQTIFECPICSRISPNELSLASHIESVHSHSKNYACPQCTARYSNRKSLVRHIGTHSGKKPPKRAVCHICGASFKGNNKLNRHLREVCEKAKLEEMANLYEQSL